MIGVVYRLLGHQRVALTRQQVEAMVRSGLLSAEAKIVRDGEGFATALSSRAEFRHLSDPGRPPPSSPSDD